MDAERWARISQIYDSVSERPHADRARFVADACAGDADLRREIDSLLAQDVSCDGPIERVAADAAVAPVFPTVIGRYRLLRLIGEGGMGAVYEAEQDHPRRTVALKIIKSPLAAPILRQRFSQEAEALGRLEHPGIARIYDAGTAETIWGAQPYFAMELIRGLPLIEYASERLLDTTRRIELMIRICEAVDHAHWRGIVHRDLKPGNILVDENGQPKVLDFGVARIADFDGNGAEHTKVGEVIGTPAYMSPEQVHGDSALLGPPSDVYSLGVVMFELLAGRLPYRVGRRSTEVSRTVREEDAPALSTIDRRYRGDLETIVAKALEKESVRRYASAGELAADLRRYLADQPILAVAPTVSYQVRKFVRRHRTLATAAASVFMVLVAGIAVSTREAILARRERDRALRAEQVAAAVNDFLQNDLLSQASAAGQAGQNSAPDRDLKVRTTLDRAAARITGKFASQPVVEAAVRRTIGKAYLDLALYPEAQQQLERVVDLRTRALGPDHADTLGAMDELALAYAYQTKYKLADPLLRSALAAAKRALGLEHPTTLALMNDLALMTGSQGDYNGAAMLLSELLAVQRKLKGDEDSGTLSIMDNLAVEYDSLGRFAEAEPLRMRVVDISQRVRAPNDPETLTSINNLGVLYRKEGKYAEAEKMLKTALDGRRRIYGEGHHSVLTSLNSLSLLYQAQGRYAEAEPLVLQVLQSARKSLGDEHVDTMRYLNNLADLYHKEGKTTEAEDAFVRLVVARRRVLGADHPNTSKALTSLAELKLERHAFADAEPLLREALHGREKLAPDSWERYYAQSMLGAALAGRGRRAEAAPLLDAGYKGLLAHVSSIPAESRPVVEKARAWKTAVGR